MKSKWFNQYFNLAYILGDNRNAFGFDSLEERTKEDVNQILKIAQINSGDRILDIPCGYGRHSIELATRGEYKIYGLDLNPFLIKIAKYRRKNSLGVCENSIKLKTKPKFMIGDMRDFSKILNGFDLIYNWFWSFGYFNENENLKVIKEFYSALKEDGRVLIHTLTNEGLDNYLKEINKETFPTVIIDKKYPKGNLYTKKEYDPKNKILNLTWLINLEDGRRFPEEPITASVKIYSIDEYKYMLNNIGFKDVEIRESYFPFKIFKGKK